MTEEEWKNMLQISFIPLWFIEYKDHFKRWNIILVKGGVQKWDPYITTVKFLVNICLNWNKNGG